MSLASINGYNNTISHHHNTISHHHALQYLLHRDPNILALRKEAVRDLRVLEDRLRDAYAQLSTTIPEQTAVSNSTATTSSGNTWIERKSTKDDTSGYIIDDSLCRNRKSVYTVDVKLPVDPVLFPYSDQECSLIHDDNTMSNCGRDIAERGTTMYALTLTYQFPSADSACSVPTIWGSSDHVQGHTDSSYNTNSNDKEINKDNINCNNKKILSQGCLKRLLLQAGTSALSASVFLTAPEISSRPHSHGKSDHRDTCSPFEPSNDCVFYNILLEQGCGSIIPLRNNNIETNNCLSTILSVAPIGMYGESPKGSIDMDWTSTTLDLARWCHDNALDQVEQGEIRQKGKRRYLLVECFNNYLDNYILVPLYKSWLQWHTELLWCTSSVGNGGINKVIDILLAKSDGPSQSCLYRNILQILAGEASRFSSCSAYPKGNTSSYTDVSYHNTPPQSLTNGQISNLRRGIADIVEEIFFATIITSSGDKVLTDCQDLCNVDALESQRVIGWLSIENANTITDSGPSGIERANEKLVTSVKHTGIYQTHRKCSLRVDRITSVLLSLMLNSDYLKRCNPSPRQLTTHSLSSSDTSMNWYKVLMAPPFISNRLQMEINTSLTPKLPHTASPNTINKSRFADIKHHTTVVDSLYSCATTGDHRLLRTLTSLTIPVWQGEENTQATRDIFDNNKLTIERDIDYPSHTEFITSTALKSMKSNIEAFCLLYNDVLNTKGYYTREERQKGNTMDFFGFSIPRSYAFPFDISVDLDIHILMEECGYYDIRPSISNTPSSCVYYHLVSITDSSIVKSQNMWIKIRMFPKDEFKGHEGVALAAKEATRIVMGCLPYFTFGDHRTAGENRPSTTVVSEIDLSESQWNSKNNNNVGISTPITRRTYCFPIMTPPLSCFFPNTIVSQLLERDDLLYNDTNSIALLAEPSIFAQDTENHCVSLFLALNGMNGNSATTTPLCWPNTFGKLPSFTHGQRISNSVSRMSDAMAAKGTNLPLLLSSDFAAQNHKSFSYDTRDVSMDVLLSRVSPTFQSQECNSKPKTNSLPGSPNIPISIDGETLTYYSSRHSRVSSSQSHISNTRDKEKDKEKDGKGSNSSDMGLPTGKCDTPEAIMSDDVNSVGAEPTIDTPESYFSTERSKSNSTLNKMPSGKIISESTNKCTDPRNPSDHEKDASPTVKAIPVGIATGVVVPSLLSPFSDSTGVTHTSYELPTPPLLTGTISHSPSGILPPTGTVVGPILRKNKKGNGKQGQEDLMEQYPSSREEMLLMDYIPRLILDTVSQNALQDSTNFLLMIKMIQQRALLDQKSHTGFSSYGCINGRNSTRHGNSLHGQSKGFHANYFSNLVHFDCCPRRLTDSSVSSEQYTNVVSSSSKVSVVKRVPNSSQYDYITPDHNQQFLCSDSSYSVISSDIKCRTATFLYTPEGSVNYCPCELQSGSKNTRQNDSDYIKESAPSSTQASHQSQKKNKLDKNNEDVSQVLIHVTYHGTHILPSSINGVNIYGGAATFFALPITVQIISTEDSFENPIHRQNHNSRASSKSREGDDPPYSYNNPPKKPLRSSCHPLPLPQGLAREFSNIIRRTKSYECSTKQRKFFKKKEKGKLSNCYNSEVSEVTRAFSNELIDALKVYSQYGNNNSERNQAARKARLFDPNCATGIYLDPSDLADIVIGGVQNKMKEFQDVCRSSRRLKNM